MLKRVSIQNFKSLKDVTLDLQKVNLLIGPNNSGKTNFLKALEFFTTSFKNDNEDYEEDAFKRLIYNRDISADNSIQVSLIDGELNTFEISIVDWDNIIWLSRNYAYSKDGKEADETYDMHDYNDEDKEQIYKLLYKATGESKIYRPNPNRFIRPVDFSADATQLTGDCSNLIQFLFYISSNFKRPVNRIENDLAKTIGDIVSFSTPPIKIGDESKLGLKFFDKKENDYWAEDVSEGVLYFLALLTIIHQPNSPRLLLFEEPEKGIHPRRIEEVINFIFGLVDDKNIQVIMTTHSPTVVDMFKDMPESVFIFDKDEEGATHIKNLQKDIIEPETDESVKLGINPPQYLNGLGQAWKVGFIGGVPR